MFDYIVIGAGLAGSVIAERIANVLDKKVLVIEKRNHIGGNCYDFYDGNGILVHKYGPHIFHTNDTNVWRYLSKFTEWHDYEHRVLGFVDEKKVPIPFNLNSLHVLFSNYFADNLKNKLINQFGYGAKISILKLKKSPDKDLKFLADFVYDKIFLNYTKKQWGMKPEDLDPSVTERVPIFVSYDNRYFQDIFQGVPQEGYHLMFERMLNHSNIILKLNTDSKNLLKIKDGNIYIRGTEFKGLLVFTGRIDELFDKEFGPLPYRSLNFEFENIQQKFYQEVGTVNYPNDFNFTRITEFKHITGQKKPDTTIVKEYPKFCDNEQDIPYYPIPKSEYEKLYKKYAKRAQDVRNLILVGRLAEFKYFNMDIVVQRALRIFEEKIK
ncbi:MAG: UDP-galactopyranose mutase [Methanobacteriaceae archaeon]|nr:UDP-galactopyranose mutase [Methanobacteriaceae archaeon]